MVQLSNVPDSGDLLAVIIDANPIAWAESATQHKSDDVLSLQNAIQQILIFVNAHLALRDENQLILYGAGIGTSQLLFSSFDTRDTSDNAPAPDANTYQLFRSVDDTVISGMKMIVEAEAGDVETPVSIVGALSKSLCHIHRITRDESKAGLKPRILILSVSPDASSQYIPIMNCIFSAQKASIPIDVCKIFGEETVFLQQASHLTNGSYIRVEHRAGLLQYLMVTFLPGRNARRHLNLPTQEQVDLRAACFCHKRIVDIGYVCSVCLSIFCAPLPVCTTCRTKFPMSTLKRYGPPPRPPAAKSAPSKGTTTPAGARNT